VFSSADTMPMKRPKRSLAANVSALASAAPSLRAFEALGVTETRRAADPDTQPTEPTLAKEILDVSVAEREAQVEPNGMLDDDRRCRRYEISAIASA